MSRKSNNKKVVLEDAEPNDHKYMYIEYYLCVCSITNKLSNYLILSQRFYFMEKNFILFFL